MTKAEIVTKCAYTLGVNKYVVNDILDEILRTIRDSVVDGEAVTIRGFGTIYASQMKPRVGRNITKNVPVNIPGRLRVKMVPSQEWNDSVNKHSKQ